MAGGSTDVSGGLPVCARTGIGLAVPMPTDFNAKAQRCKDARLKPILNPRKQAHLLAISAGGLFGLKISQFPCVFASLRLCVKDFD